MKEKKQKNNSTDVQQQAEKMMPGRICLIDAPVQDMGEPRHRNPVAIFYRGKCPLNIFQIEAGLNMVILKYETGIVKIDKVISIYATESRYASNH